MSNTPSKMASKMSSPLGAMSLVFEIGFIIALPGVGLGFAGAHLDKAWGTSPLCTIAGLLIAFILSAFIVVSRVKGLLTQSGS